MNNLHELSGEHVVKYLDGLIPVLNDLRDICADWDGKEPGEKEELALLAGDAFDTLTAATDKLTELRGRYE